MALNATLYNFHVDLSDADRQVYETVPIRAARHPSESEEFLVARVLAYLLEYADGIEFSRGVSDADEPAIVIRDRTGALTTWIEIGTPDAARLHKASKAARRVVVYCHKDPTQYQRQLAGAKIHRGEALELYVLDRSLVAALVERLDRRVAFGVSIAERELFVSIGQETLTGAVTRLGCVVRGSDLYFPVSCAT